MQDLTVCFGSDENYFEQLTHTFPVWMKYWKPLRDLPIFFFGETPSLVTRASELFRSCGYAGEIESLVWSPEHEYESQREKMLTAWVYAPASYVTTRYWLKIDSDAYPTRDVSDTFIVDEWFENNPAVVAHKWGFTKMKGGAHLGDWFEHLDKWGTEKSLILSKHDETGMRFPEGQKRFSSPRFASYIFIANKQWSESIAVDCFQAAGHEFRIPIPSQDTLHWYYLERTKDRYSRINMKKLGVTNTPKLINLKSACMELMNNE